MSIAYVLTEVPKDPSFILPNLISAFDKLQDAQWKEFGKEVNVPESILHNIEHHFHTNGERKAELLRVCVTEHPESTWERVSDALYKCKMGDEECHRTLDIVQSKYPTGEPLILIFSQFPPSLLLLLFSSYTMCTRSKIPYSLSHTL